MAEEDYKPKNIFLTGGAGMYRLSKKTLLCFCTPVSSGFLFKIGIIILPTVP
jgi:hypothetical protein